MPLTDEYGCEHTELFLIRVELRIPNTITPNDDGTNDCLKVFGLSEGSSFAVYDQTGLLIYSKNPYYPYDCWNGTDRQGKPLQGRQLLVCLRTPCPGNPRNGIYLYYAVEEKRNRNKNLLLFDRSSLTLNNTGNAAGRKASYGIAAG